MQHLWIELSKSLDIKSRCARCGLTRRTSASIWVRPHRPNEFHCTMLYQRADWEDPVEIEPSCYVSAAPRNGHAPETPVEH